MNKMYDVHSLHEHLNKLKRRQIQLGNKKLSQFASIVFRYNQTAYHRRPNGKCKTILMLAGNATTTATT